MEWLFRKPNFMRLKFPWPFYFCTIKTPHNSFQKVPFHCLMYPAWWILNGSSPEFYKISRHYTTSACRLRELFSNAGHMQWRRTKQKSSDSTWSLSSLSLFTNYRIQEGQRRPPLPAWFTHWFKEPGWKNNSWLNLHFLSCWVHKYLQHPLPEVSFSCLSMHRQGSAPAWIQDEHTLSSFSCAGFMSAVLPQ